jgi:hypothetical protein
MALMAKFLAILMFCVTAAVIQRALLVELGDSIKITEYQLLRIQDNEAQEELNDGMVCILDGAVSNTESSVVLASPFFPDGLSMAPSSCGSNVSSSLSSSSCCTNLTCDGKTHVFFSGRRVQYGHFLLNVMAPLWDKIRSVRQERQQPDNKNNADLVLHMFTKPRRRPSYLRTYLSFFGASEIHIEPAKKIPSTTLLAKRPILGLSNITLDHYNYDVDPELWKGFRSFLIEGFELPPPMRNSSQVRITFIQRRSNRRTLNLESLVEGTHRLLSNVTTTTTTKQVVEAVVRTVQFEGMELEDQFRIMSETDLLVAADGSGIINGMYMPSNSCIVSILPYGVRDLIPKKGKNFEVLFENKLGTKYVKLHSMPVAESEEVYKRAVTKTDVIGRWFMLKQNINISMDQLDGALGDCLDYLL